MCRGYARAPAPNVASHGGVPALDCLRCTFCASTAQPGLGAPPGGCAPRIGQQMGELAFPAHAAPDGPARGAGARAAQRLQSPSMHAMPCKEGSNSSGGRSARHVNIHRGTVRAGGVRTERLPKEQSRPTCSFQSLYTYRALSQASSPANARPHTPTHHRRGLHRAAPLFPPLPGPLEPTHPRVSAIAIAALRASREIATCST